MTKEELINRLLSIDRQIATRSWITAGGDLGELIDELRKEINREPSLPSNLDEAAEEYAFTNWEDNEYHEGASEGVPFDPIGYTEKVFKKGAKWMSNQLK